jgi:2'-5' RNA ligase
VQAIASVLDDPWRDRAETLWGELKALFRLPALAGVTAPHVVYQSAAAYEPGRIDSALAALAAELRPFEIETEGVGIVAGERTVLYLAVHRGPALMSAHRRVLAALTPLATGPREAYAARTWIPHITLAAGRLDAGEVDHIADYLRSHDARWRVLITNITFIPDTSRVEGWRRFDLAR